ncbi:MAG: DUF3794 domain-containing protein [Halanaerobiales bacterium]|nr:DUF3794 domain-containing protein [Halanaerobiales bacterium]
MAINFEEELIRVEYVIGEDTVTETVTERVDIPEDKPDVQRVIDVKANLRDVDATIENGGAEVIGIIEVGIIYVGEVPEDQLQQPVHFAEKEMDFTNFIDIPEAEPGMNVFADVNIRRVSFDRIDSRTVEVTVVLTKFIKITEYRQITVITEISGIPEENITEELLRIEEVIGENTVTVVFSGELNLPDGKPPIERVLTASAEVNNIETEITEEGVIIEGNIVGGVMYVADLDQQPVHFLENRFNISEAITVPGAMEDMTVHTHFTVKRVSYELISPELIELDVIVQIFVKVTQPKQVTVVIDVISDLVEVERELLRVEDVVGEDTVHETFTNRINIPPEKPEVERIIEANARVLGYTATVERGGVLLEGSPNLTELEEGQIPDEGIEGSVIYVGAVTEPPLQPVHFVEQYYNFENFIDIPGAEEGMNVHTEVEVTKASAERIDDFKIELTAILRKFAKVTEFRQLEIITDLVVISPAADECPPSYIVYVVQPGDTLWKIARRYRTTVDALIAANPGIDPNNLMIGQKICVPSGIITPRG